MITKTFVKVSYGMAFGCVLFLKVLKKEKKNIKKNNSLILDYPKKNFIENQEL